MSSGPEGWLGQPRGSDRGEDCALEQEQVGQGSLCPVAPVMSGVAPGDMPWPLFPPWGSVSCLSGQYEGGRPIPQG